MGYSTSDLAKAGLPTSLGQNNLLENMACTSSGTYLRKLLTKTKLTV